MLDAMGRTIAGHRIIELESADSTNSYALGLLQRAARSGPDRDGLSRTVVVAHEQTAGRGLRENLWESEPGKNLTFSLILHPTSLPVERQFVLSQVVSLGIVDCLDQWLTSVSIKWPNDIYVEDRKIAGILIEISVMSGELSGVVAGIGLNLNQTLFTSDAPNPVSLKLLTGRDSDLETVLYSLLEQIDARHVQLEREKTDELHAEYCRRLYRFGDLCEYRCQSGCFTARITDVDESGQLILESEDGARQGFGFKEVAFGRAER